jgi:peptidoglycan hydrolase-like protein with peptidoglycan-binding domain
LVLISASLLVLLAVPAAGLAHTHRGARTEKAAAHPNPPVVVLQFGSGYAAPHGSVRVRVLQRRLAGAGFSPGPVDGRYGPDTQQAVRDFQTATGLVIDGIAGPITLATIIRSRNTLYPGAGDTGPSSQRVRVLQRGLVKAGVNPGPVDGRYGPHTEHAVRRFQTKHGLAVNGIAAAVTLQHLHTPLTVPVGTHARRPSGRRARTDRSAHRSTRPRPVSNPSPVPTAPTKAPVAHGGGSAAPSALLLVALALLLGLVTTWFAYRERRRRPQATDPRPQGRSTPSWVAVPEASHPATHPTDQPEVPDHNSPSTTPAGLTAAPRRDDPEGWFRHALDLQEQGQATAATAAYHRADELGHGGAAANLGVLHEQQGDHTAAQHCYQTADQRGDPNGAFNLAVALEEQGQLTAAAAAYQRADQRGHPKAAANLGVLLEAQGDLTAAEHWYRKADQRGDPNGTFNLAVVLQETGDPTGALHAYQRATQLDDPQVAQMARAAAQELHAQLKPAGATTTQAANHTNP